MTDGSDPTEPFLAADGIVDLTRVVVESGVHVHALADDPWWLAAVSVDAPGEVTLTFRSASPTGHDRLVAVATSRSTEGREDLAHRVARRLAYEVWLRDRSWKDPSGFAREVERFIDRQRRSAIDWSGGAGTWRVGTLQSSTQPHPRVALTEGEDEAVVVGAVGVAEPELHSLLDRLVRLVPGSILLNELQRQFRGHLAQLWWDAPRHWRPADAPAPYQ